MKSKKAKSKSLSKSDLRLNFISTTHYHHDAFELVMIIKPMGLLKVDLLTSWHYITNQKSLKKQYYWLRPFWFIIQRLKFAQTSTFCKMLLKNMYKKYFQRNLMKNFPRNLKPISDTLGLFPNIADKPDFS